MSRLISLDRNPENLNFCDERGVSACLMSCPKLPRILLQWQLGTPLIISTETGPVSSACIAAISPVHAADMSFAPEVAPHSYVAFSQFDAAPVNSDGVFTFLGSDHDGNAIDAGSDDIKVGCLTRHLVADRSPAQRLLIALVLPPLICLLYFVVPLSGSWTAAPTSLMSFYAYSLWFEPLYIAGGFVVSSLFFTFSVQRFRAWVYLSMWVFAVLVTAIFSLSLGRDGLHQNRIINWYTQIWTSGLILLAKFISCAYLHLHNGSPSALFFELADVERCHASLPVSADDSTAGTTTSAASPRPLSASATLPLPLASASDCDTAQTAFVAVDSEQVCTRREFNHLAQFALSVILNVIGVSSYILCTYLAIQKVRNGRLSFACAQSPSF